MFSRLYLFIFIYLLSYQPTLSESTGLVQGRITDEDNRAVKGALIKLNNYNYASYSDNEGYYSIFNIEPGEYYVRITAKKYRALDLEIKVSANETTLLNATLNTIKSDIKEKKYFCSANVFNKYSEGSIEKYTADAIKRMPVESICEVFLHSNSSLLYNNQVIFRNSPGNNTKILLDGIDISNNAYGGFGIVRPSEYPILTNLGVRELQFIPGAYSAEYGDNSGGVINIISKKGSGKRFNAFMRYNTDFSLLNGYSPNSFRAIDNPDAPGNMKLTEASDAYKYAGCGMTKVEYGAGMPLPMDNSSLFFSAYYINNDNWNNTYEITDPAGNNLGNLPNNQSWIKNFTGRMKFGIDDNVSLMLGGSHGIANYGYMDWEWLYARNTGLTYNTTGEITGNNAIPEYEAKVPASNHLMTNLFARLNYSISQNSVLEFTISNSNFKDEKGRRTDDEDPMYFGGYSFKSPSDSYKISNSSIVKGNDQIIDYYESPETISKTNDGFGSKNLKQINYLTGYYEGGKSVSGANNPYGVENVFINHGNSYGFYYNSLNQWLFDAKYTLSIPGDVSHLIEAGFDLNYYIIHKFYIKEPWNRETAIDIYTDKWGGNLMWTDLNDEYNNPISPLKSSLFIQDRLQLSDLIVNAGVRIDYFNPNTIAWNGRESEHFDDIILGADIPGAESQIKFSPRIGMTYSIFEKTFASFNYGIFHKVPEFNYLYSGIFSWESFGANTFANTEMGLRKTESMQFSLNHEFKNNLGASITLYSRKNMNSLGAIEIPKSVSEIYLYYDNIIPITSKGFELSLRKMPLKGNYGYRLNYTLSRGEREFIIDNGGEAGYFRNDYDITHSLKMNFDLFWKDREGPKLFGRHILNNIYLNASIFACSGLPFTDIRDSYQINAENTGWIWLANLRISKSISSEDIFGKKTAFESLEFYIDFNNLFNNIKPLFIYSNTNSPVDNGEDLSRSESDFSERIYYKSAITGIAESYASFQYDEFGARLYNAAADINNDERVDQREKYLAYRSYLEDKLNFRQNYQIPRTVFFGIKLNL